MILVNKLANPGDIKSIVLRPDSIVIIMRNGTDKIYKPIPSAVYTICETGRLDSSGNNDGNGHGQNNNSDNNG